MPACTGRERTGQGRQLSILTSLKHIDTVKAYMVDREVQPDYFYHGPDRYWGAYYSPIPSFSVATSTSPRHSTSIEGSPQYLGTGARRNTWAVNSQDKETHLRMLQAVIELIPATTDIGPENRAEQAKAKKLLGKADERFAN